MTTSTQCPQCNTRFKVTQAQLDAHRGLVRCGLCQTVFDATERLQDDGQAELSFIARQETAPDDFPIPLDIPEPLPGKSDAATPARKKRAWPWAVGSALLFLFLLAQLAYFYRIDLAARQPGLRPALTAYCRLLHCTVPLPRQADLMSIESSSLETDPARQNVIGLEALLRNHAPYAQAYPDLELTLTDAQDKPLARRAFRPPEYLQAGESEKDGLAAGRELGVRLSLDIADIKASGYRLLLFYPQ